MADGAGGDGRCAQQLEQCGSSQLSVELDILQLSQRWEAQRTIRHGDTPGQALRKGPRLALAAISANVVAATAANPFSFTAQRQKAGRPAPQQPKQQCQQPTVRFAFNEAPACRQQGPAEAAAAAGAENLPAAAAGPGAATPSAAAPATGSGAGSVGASPSPYVLFRGRLSFAAEVDSARKFDRPTTARKPGAAAEGGLKRKLLISPGADISAAFPTLRKPSAKQQRRSLSDLGPSWSARTAAAAEDDLAAQPEASGLDVYWSDPLPLPQSGDGVAAAAAAAPGAAARAAAAAAADDDMQDTAASPASSSGGPSSPGCAGMDACCSSPLPAFSPLPGVLQHALPTVDNPDCGFPAITSRTMRDLLTHGAAAFGLSEFVVVDCRYDYEYAGGRLPGAMHLTTPEELTDFLASPRPCPDYWQSTAIIFHCEFSTERGPRAAKYVRNKDREAHMDDYPVLSYPHIFVLQGGFKAFWKSFPELCDGGYTPMDHPDFSQQLKTCHNTVKRAWAKTTHTYSRKQRQRRPSYRLRQSSGTGHGCERDSSRAEAQPEVEAEALAVLPSVVAAQHAHRK